MKWSPQSRQEYLVERQRDAASRFAKHQIRDRDARSWRCFSRLDDGRWSSDMWFEAIVLAQGGDLYVYGDISGVHFSQFTDAFTRGGSPQDTLRWMGGTSDLAHYVAQKAAIGMGLPPGSLVLENFDEQVWMYDARRYAADLLGRTDRAEVVDLDLDEHKGALPAWLVEAARWVTLGVPLDEVRHELRSDSTVDFESSWYDWGKVPSMRLIVAHEALRALVRLLDAEKL